MMSGFLMTKTPIQRLLDDIDDARDDLARYVRVWRRLFGAVMLFAALIVVGGSIGTLGWAFRVDTGPLAAGIIIPSGVGASAFLVALGGWTDGKGDAHRLRKAVRKAERAYRDHLNKEDGGL